MPSPEQPPVEPDGDVGAELAVEPDGSLAAGGGEPGVRGGGPAADGGERVVGGDEPAADAGEPAADAGEPAADAGEPAADRAPRRSDTDSPHRARARALKILFQADVRGVSPQITLARLDDEPAAREILDAVDDLSGGGELLPPPVEGAIEVELVSSEGGAAADGAGSSAGAHAGDDGGPLDDFTRTLVAGVHRDQARIDGLIARFARKWQIHRMPVVDRTVLRMATYELIHEDTSPAIVIDEAVGLAKAMSTDDSGRYVNGVLESVRRELATNPLSREVPDESSTAAEALLDVAIAPSESPASSGSEPQDGAPDPVRPPADVTASRPAVDAPPPEVEVDEAPPAVDEAPPRVEEAPPVVEPDAREASDVPLPGQPPHEDPSAALGDPSPADEAMPAPISHGQPSLFEDSLGR